MTKKNLYTQLIYQMSKDYKTPCMGDQNKKLDLNYTRLLVNWSVECWGRETPSQVVPFKWTEDTGCSLNIVFFSKILKYIPDFGLSRFPLGSVCVHNGRSNTSAAAELAEFRKITTFNEHPIRSNSKIATDVRDSTSTSATNEYRSCNYWLYLNRWTILNAAISSSTLQLSNSSGEVTSSSTSTGQNVIGSVTCLSTFMFVGWLEG